MLYLAFFHLRISGYILNVELIGFSERSDPRYERKRNVKVDSKQLEEGSCLWGNCLFSISLLLHRGRGQSQMTIIDLSDQCIVGAPCVLFSTE